MARALAKPHVRVIAVDDGAFRRSQRFAPLVAVVYSAPSHVEAILRGRVTVDGTDATERIVELLERSAHLDGARAVLLDGVAVGGFNVVDLDALRSRLRRPVIAVTRDAPRFDRIKAALDRYFPEDARERWRRVRAHRLFLVPTDGEPIRAAAAGCRRREAVELLHRLTVQGHWPEPLRLAHLVAHAYGAPAPAFGGAARRPRRRPPVRAGVQA